MVLFICLVNQAKMIDDSPVVVSFHSFVKHVNMSWTKILEISKRSIDTLHSSVKHVNIFLTKIMETSKRSI